MRQFFLLIALGAAGCDREEQQSFAPPKATAVELPKGPTSKPPATIAMPRDQVELDRMILAGYTPHGTHLHPPGVKECPLTQGSEAVM